VVDYIFTNAILEGASDIHIEPKEESIRVRYRIDGILHHKTDLPVSLAPSLASRIKVLCKLDIAEKRKHQDGRIHAQVMDKDVDLRVSVYAAAFGENIVIRILYRKSTLIDIDQLGGFAAEQGPFPKDSGSAIRGDSGYRTHGKRKNNNAVCGDQLPERWQDIHYHRGGPGGIRHRRHRSRPAQPQTGAELFGFH